MLEYSPAIIDLLFFGNGCNLCCHHCFYQEQGAVMTGKGIERDLATAKRIIGRYRGDASFFVYPKEITTSVEVAELLPTIGQTRVLSNGIALDDGILERLKGAGITDVKITLFADRATHAIFNGISQAQYDAIIRNIGRCKQKEFRVVVEMVLTKSSIPTIPRLARQCSDLGVDKIEFLRLKPIGQARASFSHELVGEPEMLRAIETIERLKCDYPKLYFGYNMSCGPDFHNKTLKQARDKVAKGQTKSASGSGSGYLCLSIGMKYFGVSLRTGKIYGCFFTMDEEDFLLGAMDLDTGEITGLKEDFLNPGVLSEKLRGDCHRDNCAYHEICLGGCRSCAYIFAKRRGEADPMYAGMDVCVTKCKEKLGM